MDQKDLRIVTWNANGLLNRKQEFEIFMNTQNVDICLISETHFTNHSYLKIKGYEVYHTSHPENQAKGGSAVVIKKSIDHFEEQHLQYNMVQLTMVSIKSTKQKLIVGALYCPPKHNIKPVVNKS